MTKTDSVRRLADVIDGRTSFDADDTSDIANILRSMADEIDDFRSYVRGRGDFASDGEYEAWKDRQRRELIQCRRPFETPRAVRDAVVEVQGAESASDRIDAALAAIGDGD